MRGSIQMKKDEARGSWLRGCDPEQKARALSHCSIHQVLRRAGARAVNV